MNWTRTAVMVTVILLSLGCGYARAADQEGADKLLKASGSGDLEGVKAALTSGVAVDVTASSGATPLMLAAVGGHAEIAGLLIEKGADINVATKQGVTALMLASLKGHTEVVKLLLDNGADLDAEDLKGWTALYLATKNSHTVVAEILTKVAKATGPRPGQFIVSKVNEPNKCLPVLKNPVVSSEQVACLTVGQKLVSAGVKTDSNWMLLKRPFEGWVPADTIKRVSVGGTESKAQSQATQPRRSRSVSTSYSNEATAPIVQPKKVPDDSIWRPDPSLEQDPITGSVPLRYRRWH